MSDPLDDDPDFVAAGHDYNEARERLLFEVDEYAIAHLAAVVKADGSMTGHMGVDGDAEAIPESEPAIDRMYAGMAVALARLAASEDGDEVVREAFERSDLDLGGE